MPQNATAPNSVVYDKEVDWLIAGSGAAGMTGAVVAHQLGGSVLVVEGSYA